MLQHITGIRKQSSDADLVLMARIVRADPMALEMLYCKYQRKIYSVVLRIVKNEEDACEILQDVFLQVWQKASLFDGTRGTVAPWLVRVAHNMSINLLRSRLSKKVAFEINQDHQELSELSTEKTIERHTPLDDQIQSDERKHVLALLERIPADQREILILSYYGCFSQSEIAKKLDQPLGTVKTRMRGGIMKLHQLAKKTELRSVARGYALQATQ